MKAGRCIKGAHQAKLIKLTRAGLILKPAPEGEKVLKPNLRRRENGRQSDSTQHHEAPSSTIVTVTTTTRFLLP
jgi:hypothetical protein